MPLVVDFAAMREAAKVMGKDPEIIEPLVPAHLIMDHSVQIDHYGSKDALRKNMEVEFTRNRERYEFLKWSAQAFSTFEIVPPGNGICHQINLEYISRVVWQKGDMCYPDSLVGIDSHTTMVNGLGVLGWGVGGIEAEAAMLGQPMYFLEPDVVGVHRRVASAPASPRRPRADDHGAPPQQESRREVRQSIRRGRSLARAPDRATIGNMSPEYGATCGFSRSTRFLRVPAQDGPRRDVPLVKAYYEAQGSSACQRKARSNYSNVVELDLSTVKPSVAAAPPARPCRPPGAQRRPSRV